MVVGRRGTGAGDHRDLPGRPARERPLRLRPRPPAARQEAAISALLGDRDVLLVAPTGSGKSLTYQAAGLVLPGCTVVVSPLLALQQDQVEAIAASGAGAVAARVSSAETPARRDEILARAAAGDVDFPFLGPEQLANPEVRERVAATRPSLVAVDEAHCVSTWGQDFRPDYFRLGELLAGLGPPPRLVAMTATAAAPVREDIVARLGLRRPATIVTGFARENIALDVVRVADPDEQRAVVLATVTGLAREHGGAGIVYCRTRPATEEYAAAIAEQELRTAVYHAGLPGAPGRSPRGVPGGGGRHDRGDVRLRHGDRQAGRAPRRPRPGPGVPGHLLPGGRTCRARRRTRHGRSGDDVEAVLDLAEARRRLERSRVDMMRAYAETERCRAEFLVGYFGERVERCGRCDNCRSGSAPESAGDAAPYPVGSAVRHEKLGAGVVTDVEADRLTVLFDDVGYRALSLAVVEEQGLLETTGTAGAGTP